MRLISYASLDAGLSKAGGYFQDVLLLIVRLWWGWSFFGTGWGKLLNLGRTPEFFAELGLPLPLVNAALAGGVECLGGLLLLLGLWSRAASVPLASTMLVAYATADREALSSIFSNPDAFTGAAPFLFLFSALLVFAFGPGCYSVDAWLARRLAPAVRVTT